MTGRSTEVPLSVPSGVLRLEGVLHQPPGDGPVGGVVVCHPHPLYGGDMESHVVYAICRALAEHGVAALRFNFRGTGSSQGRHAGGQGEPEDVRAALTALAEQPGVDGERLGLAGYSFGASMALQAAADPRVRALALVSLPARSGDQLAAFAGPTLLVTGEHDHVAPPEELRRLIRDASGERDLLSIPGVDHFWLRGLTEMTARLVLFFRKWLSPGSG